MFDGSSIAGWKNINESDMILMPDPDTAVLHPFTAQPQLILFLMSLNQRMENHMNLILEALRKAEGL